MQISHREFATLAGAALVFGSPRGWAAAPDIFVPGFNLPANLDPHQILDVGATGYALNTYDNLYRYEDNPPWLRPTMPPVRAVGGVSLTVQKGEIVGLVGESGCGKTTLGRTLLGLQRETSGEIELDGNLVSGLSPKKARRQRNDIQYVHQDGAAALDPWWSIGRTLEEGLKIHGIATAAERQKRVDKSPKRSDWTISPGSAIRTNFRAVSCAASRSPAFWYCGRVL